MFEEIGTVRNFADAEDLRYLALFKDSVSAIEFSQGVDPLAYSTSEYSHYIVVHTPLDTEQQEQGKESTRRFCGGIGVSIVKCIKADDGEIHFRGLMATNGSKVYAILPYTHLDAVVSKDASFPEARTVSTRNRIWPGLLSEIKGRKILDVGCGFGRLTLDVASKNPDSEVIGIDIHDAQTGQATMNAEAFEIKNVEFRTASAYDLPFEDGSFDMIYSFFMLHHLNEIPKGLSEIRRVLQKEGRYLATEPTGHHHGPNYFGTDWLRIFKEAGFSAKAEETEGAVIIRASKK